MTINNKKLRLVENAHSEKTMANLSKLLKDNDMSQVELAKQLGRDKTTVNRWVKNSREVAWDNAVEISKVLKCHPVDIIEGGKSEIVLKEKCNWDGRVWNLKKEDQFWRALTFIHSAITKESVSSLQDAYEAGYSLANFHYFIKKTHSES